MGAPGATSSGGLNPADVTDLPVTTAAEVTTPDIPPSVRPGSRTGWALFFLAVAAYAATRLIAIEDYPIYFFCDEAIHPVAFREMVANRFRGIEAPQEILPAYFRNGRMLNLSLSVYVQGVTSYLFGQTVATVRTTSALASLSGAIALALLLRRVFRAREWWSVVAFLTVMPALLLHSRTGFECVLMFSSYSWFLYFYLRYREENPRFIFAAMLFGAATFYSYSPGQGLMLITGIFLLISDLAYHWRQRGWAGAGLGFGLLLFAPYARFRILHPQMLGAHLAEIQSYWVQPISLPQKLLAFVRAYLAGYDPRYWFVVDSKEIIRHVFPGFAFIPMPLAPLAGLGFILCLARWRSAAHRALLGALLASGFSGALAMHGVTRNLGFLVSMAMFMALAFDWLAGFVRTAAWKYVLQWGAAGVMAAGGFVLLANALMFGPTQTRIYDLFGMQWGAQAVFRDLIPRQMRTHPTANVFISHVWANNAEVFPRFFGWSDFRRVYFFRLEDVVVGGVLPRPRDLVLLTAPEFESIPKHEMIERFEVLERVAWPDGRPGFYLGHLHLRPEFIRHSLATFGDTVSPKFVRLLAGGIPCAVFVTRLESGDGDDIFTTSDHSALASKRGEDLRVEIQFDQPVAIDEIIVTHTGEWSYEQQIWAGLDNGSATGHHATGKPGEPGATARLEGKLIQSVRLDSRGGPGEPVALRFIEIIPSSPRGQSAR